MTKRPSQNDDRVIQKLAELAVPKVVAWCGADSFYDEDASRQELHNQLVKAFKYQNDGYEAVRSFDDDTSNSGDTELVEIFNDILLKKYSICDQLTREWVKENQIVPKLKYGDQVKFKYGDVLEGKIIKVDSEVAKYTVCIPSKGHAEVNPDKSKSMHTFGSIIPFEDVEDNIVE